MKKYLCFLVVIAIFAQIFEISFRRLAHSADPEAQRPAAGKENIKLTAAFSPSTRQAVLVMNVGDKTLMLPDLTFIIDGKSVCTARPSNGQVELTTSMGVTIASSVSIPLKGGDFQDLKPKDP